MKTNERISREKMLMEVARVVARRGTCSRAQVGVVFAREGRILATGYNGAPPGVAHCIHESFTWPTPGDDKEIPISFLGFIRRQLDETGEAPSPGTTFHTDGKQITITTVPSDPPGCRVVEHAERNAIAFAAREGIRLGGSDVYCTHAPCLDCARALLGTGIQSLVYLTPYRLTAGVELLRQVGIEVIDLSIQVG